MPHYRKMKMYAELQRISKLQKYRIKSLYDNKLKKDAALLETLHSKFVSGAVKSGEDERLVEQFWADLMEFARYAFNAQNLTI